MQNNPSTITCPNNHILLQTKDLHPKSSIEFLNTTYTCKSCHVQFSRDDSCHFCVLCQFDLCQECYDIQSNVRISCPSGHILFKTPSINTTKFHKSKAFCNNCRSPCDPNDLPTSCLKCRYDLCSSCSGNYQARISQLDNLLKHNLDNQNKEESSRTIGTCDKSHPLVLIEEPPPKGLGSMLISLLKSQRSYICMACGLQFDDVSKEVSLYSCKACKFDLCSGCCQLTKAINFRCPKEHKLYFVSSLKQFSKSYFKENNYQCACCGKKYDSEISPSCHCRTCSFDLCLQCCASYQLLRNHKEQKMEQILSILNKKEEDRLEEQSNKFTNHVEGFKEKGDSSEKVKEKEDYVEEEKKEENLAEGIREKGLKEKENNKELGEGMLCVVCLNSARSHVFTPCNHLCVCEGCSADVIRKKAGCPICRTDIQGTVKVFMS